MQRPLALITGASSGIGRANLTDKHWIYYPEDSLFHRIFVQGNASPHNNAPGGFALTAKSRTRRTSPCPATAMTSSRAASRTVSL